MTFGDLEYLMTSLPYLTFRDSEEFKMGVFSILKEYAGPSGESKNLVEILDEEAEKYLAPKLAAIFRRVTLTNVHQAEFRQHTGPVLSAYSLFSLKLKEAIRDLRIARRQGQRVPDGKARPLILEPGTPLEEERQVLELQWKQAEEVSVGHHTDFGALVAYKLKLMILLRWWGFDTRKGLARFTEYTTGN